MNSRQRRKKEHAQRMFQRHLPKLFRKTYGPVLEELFMDYTIYGTATSVFENGILTRVDPLKIWNQPIILGAEHGIVFKED